MFIFTDFYPLHGPIDCFEFCENCVRTLCGAMKSDLIWFAEVGISKKHMYPRHGFIWYKIRIRIPIKTLIRDSIFICLFVYFYQIFQKKIAGLPDLAGKKLPEFGQLSAARKLQVELIETGNSRVR